MQPRLLTKSDAAQYCGLSPSGFGEWVREGRLPNSIPNTHRWDKNAIDNALDELSGIETATNVSALDEWRRKKNARVG